MAPGEEILGEPGLRYVKFQIEEQESDNPKVYFINTNVHHAHTMFMRAVGKPRGPWGMRGALIYRPFLLAPDGTPGLYTFTFEMQSAWSFDMVQKARDLLAARSPLMTGKLADHPMSRHLDRYVEEKAQYEAAGFPVLLPGELYGNLGYLPLNLAESYGRLRVMGNNDRPDPRDIVIYRTLPNEMPRVAGILTEVPVQFPRK